MAKGNNSITIILVVLFGIFMQELFYVADSKDTPHKAVVEFTKAYYGLDPSMCERLCNELRRSNDVVAQHINCAAQEAKDRGFGLNYMKSKLFHVVTHTVSKGENQARIKITGYSRTAINPVYPFIADIFNIGNTYEVDQTLQVIKEDGKWKVCGQAFSLLHM